MGYRVKKQFAGKNRLRTVLNGKAIALIEAYTYTTKATAKNPPRQVSIPLATQSELKALFERGDPCIEKFDDEKKLPAEPKQATPQKEKEEINEP